MSIQGSGFHVGATVTLVGPSRVSGVPITVGQQGLAATATLDLTSAKPGAYSITVTNTDGTSSTLPGDLTVQQGGAANVWMELLGSPYAGVGIPEPYTILYGNSGNIDAHDFLLTLTIPSTESYNLGCPSPTPDEIGLTWLGSNWCQIALGYQNGSNTYVPIWIYSIPMGSSGSQDVALTLNQPPGPPHSSFTAMSSELAGYASPFASTGDINEVSTSPIAQSVAQGAADAFSNPQTQDQQNLENNLKNVINYCDGYCKPFGQIFDFGPIKAIFEDLGAAVGIYADAVFNAALQYAKVVLSQYIDPQNLDIQQADSVEFIAPGDPNELEGSTGVGGARWVAGQRPLNYAVFFENDPSATAPAQSVLITNPLDANLNLSSLSLTQINIPSIQVSIPPTFFPSAGRNEINTSVDLRPSQSLIVNINATLNPTSRVLTWTFTSIDPNTGLGPSDPTVGFLQPGTSGSVFFSGNPQLGVSTSTEISDQATVVFNVNPPDSTATWTNTIDNTPPVSAVSALGTTQTTSCFRPQWTVSDVGSGVQGTTIFVSDTGGAYTPWLTKTTAASAIYNGAAGHTYAFYSQATDLVGNLEATHASPDASTSVPSGASCNGRPTIAGSVARNSLSGTTETLTLRLTNNGAGNAQNININSVSLRTLIGTGAVTLSSPATPISVGSLAAGASTMETLTLNAPATVKEYSITEAGTVQDAAGNAYSFSIAQAIIP